MHALPLVLSTLAALAIGALAAHVPERERARAHELRGREHPVPARAADPRRGASSRWSRSALLDGLFDEPEALGVAGLFLVLGVCVLGLADDAYAGPVARLARARRRRCCAAASTPAC